MNMAIIKKSKIKDMPQKEREEKLGTVKNPGKSRFLWSINATARA